MRPAVATTALLITGVLLSPAAASGQGRGAGGAELKPFFDSRAGVRAPARTPRARTALRSRLGRSGVLDVNPITNTPRSLLKLDGALTGPSGAGRDAIARSFLRANAGALGLSASDVDALDPATRVDAPGGVRILRYGQSFHGIPTFDNGVRVALDRAGRVLGVTGSPQAGLSVASTTPELGAAAAMRALQRSVSTTRAMRVSSGPSGARRTTRFATGEQARLTLFGARSGPRLAWRVDFRAGSSEHYDGIVDARTGRLLYRANRVKGYSARVFDYYAGAPQGGDPTRLQNLSDQTPLPWLPTTATNLTGPYSHAWSDVNDDNVANPSEEVTPTGGDFQFSFVPFNDNGPPRCTPTHLCSWDPVGDRSSWQTNREQTTTEAFFLVSKYHDHLARSPIGFNAASGAFQTTDPVLTQSLDGADTAGDGGPDDDHTDNANMDTPPGDQSPTMQLFLFEYSDALPFFDYNGDDAATVWHEYTHGLSNRLITDEDGVGALNSAHAGAMGEAWSDWYAEDLLVRDGFETDDPDLSGEIDLGEPSDAVRHETRSEAIDCPAGVGASDPDSACPGGAATGPGGYTLGDFGNIAGGPEVHADGEIWVQTLWDLRTQLVDANDGDDHAGSDEAEALVTMGMRLAPPEPSMLDMRNAILQADTALNGGARRDLVWSVFAHRGMGFYASVFDSSDAEPAENFNVPPAAGTPQGNLHGTVSDSQTGLPLAGAVLRIGAATTASGAAALTATTGPAGRYAIDGVTEGTYGKLAVRPAGGGYDPADVHDVVIRGGETTTKDVALNRNWASKPGGASIASANDDLNGPACGPEALIDDQDGGLGWKAFNPTSEDYPPALSGDAPTATIALPSAVDISAIGIDPANTCGTGASAALKGYKLEVSSGGTTFRTFSEGAFTPGQAGNLNLLDATGGAGANVRRVRLTMLSPQNDAPGFTGHDFITATSLEVFGAVPNVLPAGALKASPAAVAPGQTVSFDASSFTDPDSRITGYDWDFDGNGSVDRTTDTPRTDFAYAAAGTFAPKVMVKDFRGGAGTASTTVTVAAAPPPPGPVATPPATTPRPLPVITIAGSGTRGRFTLRVTCAQRCALSGKVTLTRSLARKLHRKRLTVTTVRRTIASTRRQTIRVKLSKSVIKALEQRGLKSLKVSARFSARYADGRRKTASRRLRVRR
jgi:extracellular elastinolytic metalloproteinase